MTYLGDCKTTPSQGAKAMRLIPEPDGEDIVVFAASQLTTGLEIVNVGTVVDRREEGAFVHVAIEHNVWDQPRGIPVRTVEWRFFHASDDVWIFERPVRGE